MKWHKQSQLICGQKNRPVDKRRPLRLSHFKQNVDKKKYKKISDFQIINILITFIFIT